jgi:hypothetical protein
VNENSRISFGGAHSQSIVLDYYYQKEVTETLAHRSGAFWECFRRVYVELSNQLLLVTMSAGCGRAGTVKELPNAMIEATVVSKTNSCQRRVQMQLQPREQGHFLSYAVSCITRSHSASAMCWALLQSASTTPTQERISVTAASKNGGCVPLGKGTNSHWSLLLNSNFRNHGRPLRL